MSTAGTADNGLSTAEFDRVRELFYRRTGIRLTPEKRYYVDKRVLACIEDSGEPSFASWFARLRLEHDDRLMQALVNRLTVNETYFLRESHQLDALVRHVMPACLEARGGRGPLRILCVPCASGDEPYSVALRLLEDWPPIAHVDVQITGLDIDTAVLARARQGVYGERALRNVPPAMVAAYFTPVPGGHRIADGIREAIDFRQANITDPASMAAHTDVDVVLCRNLLIYFDELSSRRAAENLFGVLRPGGFLFLGHTESMSRISSIFRPVRLSEGVIYQRPEVGGQ